MTTGTSADDESILSPLSDAIAAMAAGRMIIIVDDEDRENEGDLVIAAERVTAEAVNFMATQGRGLICCALEGTLLDRLQLPMMVPTADNRSGFGTGFTLSVEAASGVTTGISAADRAHTIRTLIDPASTPDSLAVPGHVFPLRARPGGVLERRGQTEASVDMARLAGMAPAGVICEVMREDGEMMRLEELVAFGSHHGIPVCSVEQIVAWRTSAGDTLDIALNAAAPEQATALVSEVGRSVLPTHHGEFEIVVFRDTQGLEHTALTQGDVSGDDVLVRMHSECLTGDAFGSLRCDCGPQLQKALANIAREGRGALLYLRQEGRGIGLGNKIRAYALQDQGFDTVDANHALGFPADARSYDVAAAMLTSLGVNSVRLLSNNPTKRAALDAHGIRVSAREPLITTPQQYNDAYLATKARRMRHDLPLSASLAKPGDSRSNGASD